MFPDKFSVAFLDRFQHQPKCTNLQNPTCVVCVSEGGPGGFQTISCHHNLVSKSNNLFRMLTGSMETFSVIILLKGCVSVSPCSNSTTYDSTTQQYHCGRQPYVPIIIHQKNYGRYHCMSISLQFNSSTQRCHYTLTLRIAKARPRISSAIELQRKGNFEAVELSNCSGHAM